MDNQTIQRRIAPLRYLHGNGVTLRPDHQHIERVTLTCRSCGFVTYCLPSPADLDANRERRFVCPDCLGGAAA